VRLRTGLLLTALISPAGLLLAADPAAAVTVSTEAELQAAFADTNETQIDLANDIDLTCAGGGDLDRNAGDPLSVNGHGFTIRQTCPGERVIHNVGGGALTLQQVAITGGSVADDGGGVYSDGDLTLVEATVVGNVASGAGSSGGGVYGIGDVVELVRSTVAGNIAAEVGGGVFASAQINLVNSTVTGNQATEGGGLSSQQVGGPGVVLVYSTVVANQALAGANIAGQGVESFGSVIALGTGGGQDCFVPLEVSNGYNFVGDGSCGFAESTDIPSGGDPLVGLLGPNGGPTPTMLPLPDSPLIDAIPTPNCQDDGAALVTIDQRGVVRPQINGCDIGSVEVAPVGPEPVLLEPTFTG